MSKIFICGDIFNENSTNFISKEISDIISQCEVSICNFEAPITDEVSPTIKAGPCLKQYVTTVKCLYDSGFNLFLLANNHIFDYGQKGVKDTINELNKFGVEYIGIGRNYNEIFNIKIKIISGYKVGFINTCEFHNGAYDSENNGENNDYAYLWINHPHFEKFIKEVKNKVDKLFLFVHCGLENTEIPLYEWKIKYKLFLELGVDYIIGSHPHVPQGYDQFGDKYIFYSLGNFYFNYNKQNNKNKISSTFNLIIDVENNWQISFLFTDEYNGLVTKSNSFNVNDLLFLNKKLNSLNGKKYSSIDIAEAEVKKIEDLFLTVFFSFNRKISFKNLIKFFYYRIFLFKKREKYFNTLRAHFFNNETYQYVIKDIVNIDYLKN